MRSAKTRPYRMRARQESVEATRLRITEAAVRLHERVGPARTSISAIADEAGVTRLTVYRHFPDEVAVLSACSAHWASQHPQPDLERWRRVRDPVERLHLAVSETYAWLEDAGPMMAKVVRDLDDLPPGMRDAALAEQAARVAVVARGLAATPPARRRTKALVAHTLSPTTWQSLCVDGGLTGAEAVATMSSAVLTAAGRR